MKLSIARIYYPVTTLGPGRRVGIWTTGCPRRCPGCISPELQDYDPGREVAVGDILAMIRRLPGGIDGFTVSGGEPFLHPAALHALVRGLADLNDDILIFTGFTLAELEEKDDPEIRGVLEKCAVLVDGPYVRELHCSAGLRGSDNQRIHVFKHREKYPAPEACERSLQTIVRDGAVITLGIP